MILCLFISSCDKEEIKIVQPETSSSNINIRSERSDNYEFDYIFERIKSMTGEQLVNFMNNYGQPSWVHGSQKRGTNITITSVPVLSLDTQNDITGILRMYETIGGDKSVYFFSVNELNKALSETLNAIDFNIYRGAIQSLVLSADIVGVDLDDNYLNWLGDNTEVTTAALQWDCIEVWECHYFKRGSATNWITESGFDNWTVIPGFDGDEYCILISRECWVDWTPRTFPSNSGESGEFDDNPGGNGSGSGTGGLTSYNAASTAARTTFLNNWLAENGIGTEYFDLLYDCTGYLDYEPGGDFTAGISEDCAFETLAEEMTECLQFDFVGCDESPNGICPESFKFINTGNAFTCEVNSTSFKYFGAENFTRYVGTICIQVSEYTNQDELISTPSVASDLMTDAWETAQFLTGTEFAASNHSQDNKKYKDLFISNLLFGINSKFRGGTVSGGPCAGSVPSSKPIYSLLCF